MKSEKQDAFMILGEAASSGVARGKAFVCTCGQRRKVPRRQVREHEIPAEMERLETALAQAASDLMDLQNSVRETIGEKEAAIFDAHIALLHDPLLKEEIEAVCREKRINIEAALKEAVEKMTSLFVRMEDALFRERAADLSDVGKRVGDILAAGIPAPAVFPEGSIIITRELLPSIFAQLDRKLIRGLVIEEGGQTAHATILARSAGIPLLIRVPGAVEKIRKGQDVIVDGYSGRIFVNPDAGIKTEYDRFEETLQKRKAALEELVEVPVQTEDGQSVKLCANIGKLADAELASRFNADGAGLYRTEFVFLAHDRLPSEEEQYRIYASAVERLKSRPAAIRLLDIGSDKILPYLPLPPEVNPSLGQRGMRLLRAHPEILYVQLRAILRVSAEHPVSILLPMVNGVEDVIAAREAVDKVKMDLRQTGHAFNPEIRIGAMIETPSAAVLVEQLVREVDYFSIGTNDLVQYLLTTDRGSSAMAAYYEPLHPAVIQTLASIARVAATNEKSVSVCGEMAGNAAYTKLLLGLGFRSFSVSPSEILEIKNVILSTDLKKAEALARKALRSATVKDIKAMLRFQAGEGIHPEINRPVV